MESNSLNCSSIQTVHSIEFKFRTYIIGYRSTYCVDFGEFRINNFFYRSTKKNSYTLRPMESNSLKCSSIQTVHSIELKFGMHIIVHRLIYCVDFGEFSINSFFTGVQKKNSYTLRPTESNSLKCSSIQTIHSIDLKFGMYVIDYRSTNYIDFGE